MPRLFLLVCLTLMTASTVAMAEPSLEAKEMAKTVPIADMHMHAYTYTCEHIHMHIRIQIYHTVQTHIHMAANYRRPPQGTIL